MTTHEMTAADYHKLITEADFTTQVMAMARSYGWLAYHTHDSRRSEKGYPDIHVCHPVYGSVYIELKTETGRVSRDQRRWLATLHQSGSRAFVARPRHRDALESLFRGDDVPDDAFEVIADF